MADSVRIALSLTSRLGEKYLWVDTLCIVQDDAATKHNNISRMNIIYDQAILTIVALSGFDANAGLPGIHTRGVIPGIENMGNLRLSCKPTELDRLLWESRYETRRWTFQERLLSRRCLFFSEQQVDFVCQESHGYLSSADAPPEDLRLQLHSKVSNPIQIPLRMETYHQKIIQCFDSYSYLVELYSSRAKNLTRPSDICHAFLGVEAQMKRLWKWNFHSSLPEKAFDIALLWIPTNDTRRRRSKISLHGKSDWFAPSWSWTGWIGGALYDQERMSASESSQFWKVRSIDSLVSEFRALGAGMPYVVSRSPLICRTGALENRSTRPMPTPSNQLRNVSTSSTPLDRTLKHISIPAQFLECEASHGQSETSPSLPRLQQSPTDKLVFEAEATQIGVIPNTNLTHPTLRLDGNQCGALYGQDKIPLKTGEVDQLYLVALSSVYIGKKDWLESSPLFDTKTYPLLGCCLYNVLLIKWSEDTKRGERVAVGQIHSSTWRASKRMFKNINLV